MKFCGGDEPVWKLKYPQMEHQSDANIVSHLNIVNYWNSYNQQNYRISKEKLYNSNMRNKGVHVGCIEA